MLVLADLTSVKADHYIDFEFDNRYTLTLTDQKYYFSTYFAMHTVKMSLGTFCILRAQIRNQKCFFQFVNQI